MATAKKKVYGFRLPEVLAAWVQEAAKQEGCSYSDIVFDALWNAMIIYYMKELGKEEEIPALLKSLEEVRNAA